MLIYKGSADNSSAGLERTPDLVEGVPDVQISVGVGRSVVQDVLVAGVVLQKLLVDALLVPEGLQLGLSLHGVRALKTKGLIGVEVGSKSCV